MPQHEPHKPLSQAERLAIFQALAEAQDRDERPLERLRKAVAERFGISEHQVRHIEHEGLEGNWPRYASE